jgi:hypothetical protein
MSFETVVQTAIFTKLINDAPLMAAVVSVSDTVLQGDDSGNDALFPYVTLGEDAHTDISTDIELMDQVSITIHVWSRLAGRQQTKQIQGLIYDSLNRANLVQSGYKLININRVNSESQLDSDGFTRHGIQTFNLIIQEL